MKILIADDNIDLTDSLADILADEGHDVDVVYNGHAAIDKFKQNDYELSLLDAKLPDIPGIKVFSQFNSMKPDKRIIVMTGFRVEQLLAYGTGDNIIVMRKPVLAELVLKNLGKMDKGVILVADNRTGLHDELFNLLSQGGRKLSVISDNVDREKKSILNNDVLIFDTRQTVLYDLNAYEKIKEAGYKGTAIILIKQGQANEDALKSMVITGCLFKPFDPQELLDAIGI